jgi:hypothetical protein
MPKWVPNLCRPSLLLTYCNRGCGKKGASKYHTPVFFFSFFVCFVRFWLFAHFVTHSLSLGVCVLLSSPARHLREVLSFRRGEDFGASDLASLFFIFIFFFFSFFIFGFVCFLKFVFWLKNHPEGFVSLVPLEELGGFCSLFCTQWWF